MARKTASDASPHSNKRRRKEIPEEVVSNQGATRTQEYDVEDVEEAVPVQASAAQEMVQAGEDTSGSAVPTLNQPLRQDRNVLSIRISSDLKAKLLAQAGEEGISVDEYVGELLAEGVVLRAWEIVEKKAQMRGLSSPHPQSQGGGNPRNNNNNNNRLNNNNPNDRFNNRRGMSNSRYNSIMDDKASFLEYVRSQERQQGR